MRICGRQISLLALATFALAACGGGGDDASGASGSNLPPIIQGSPVTTLAAGSNYSFKPRAADPDGDNLTFAASNLPGWTQFDGNTGEISGTPGEADVGMSGDIIIEVSDSKAVAQLPAFRIQVASSATAPPAGNNPPTIEGRPSITATTGRLYTFTPVGNDVDNDDLIYTINNQPDWATFTTATGELRGTPGSADVGTTADIVISVSDGEEVASLAAFDLTVGTEPPAANRAPVITGNPATTASVGRRYSFRPVGSDADGDSLVYAIQNKPSWAQFSTTTGRLWGTPTAASVGASGRITITVSDNTAEPVALPSFTIQVSGQANRAPTIRGTPVLSLLANAVYNFQPTATDPDGDTLSFRVTNLPSWATFNTATGQLSGTPGLLNIGSFAGIVISVSDGTATTSLPAFSLSVLQVGVGIATVSWTAPTLNTDGSALVDLAGYKVVYGRSPTELTQSAGINTPGLNTFVVTNLTSGEWFFAVRAVNAAGLESNISNVASKIIP